MKESKVKMKDKKDTTGKLKVKDNRDKKNGRGAIRKKYERGPSTSLKVRELMASSLPFNILHSTLNCDVVIRRRKRICKKA
jgi:hypothetical protein